MQSIWAATQFEFQRICRKQRLWLVGFFLMFPALLWLLIVLTSSHTWTLEAKTNAYINYQIYLLLQVILPLVCLLYGSAMFRDEVEDRSITFLLICPVHKGVWLSGKYLATLLLMFPLVIISVITTSLVFWLPHGIGAVTGEGKLIMNFVVVGIMGSLAYCALFTLIGLITRWALVAGLIYIVLVEFVMSMLPKIILNKITISYYLRNLLDFASMSTLGKYQQNEFIEYWNPISKGEAVISLLVMSGVFILASIYWLKTREWESQPVD